MKNNSLISLTHFFVAGIFKAIGIYTGVGLMLLVLFLSNCKKVNEELKEEQLRSNFRQRLGLSEMKKVEDKDKKITFNSFFLVHYKGDKRHYNIRAKQSLLYIETKVTDLEEVKLTLFSKEDNKADDLILAKNGFIDEHENVTLFNQVQVLFSSKKINIFAEYLFYDGKTEKITFLTNVVFDNKGGENAVIKGQYFVWDKKEESITSHQQIEVLKDNGDTIISEGFYSDQEFENTVFTNAVGSTEIETE